MRRLGALAVAVAKRHDVSLCVSGGKIILQTGGGAKGDWITAQWDDDETIDRLIYDLNHGRLKE